jgi:hypothetical protein
MTFVTIQDSRCDPLIVRQRFVTLQPVIDVVNSLPQTLGVHQRIHTPDAVGAAHGLPEPAAKEAGVSGLFRSIEAAHAGPEHDRDRFDDDRGRNAWLKAPVNDCGNDGPGEVKDLLGISDQAAENAQPFLAMKRFHSSSETSSRSR